MFRVEPQIGRDYLHCKTAVQMVSVPASTHAVFVSYSGCRIRVVSDATHHLSPVRPTATRCRELWLEVDCAYPLGNQSAAFLCTLIRCAMSQRMHGQRYSDSRRP